MDNNNKKPKESALRKTIIESLAEHLGVDYKDITDEDSLVDDLHMQPSDLTDFFSSLESRDIDTSDIDLKEIETVSDLIENIALSQPL
jgi:Phosphopantetheine attachment site.